MLFDTTLKELLQAPPRRLLELLVGAQTSELLTVEYPAVRMRRPDLVARLTDGRLYHLELQSDPDPEMPWRMLEYYILLRRQYRQPPVQQVLYVGGHGAMLQTAIEEDNLSFRYAVVDIRGMDAEALLVSPSLEDNLLAILCRGEGRELIRRILGRIGGLPKKAQLDALAKLLVLSQLRGLQALVGEECQQMPIRVDISEIPLLRDAYLRGEVTLLRRQLEGRFGPLPEWAVQKLQTAGDTDLERWAMRVLQAASLEDALST